MHCPALLLGVSCAIITDPIPHQRRKKRLPASPAAFMGDIVATNMPMSSLEVVGGIARQRGFLPQARAAPANRLGPLTCHTGDDLQGCLGRFPVPGDPVFCSSVMPLAERVMIRLMSCAFRMVFWTRTAGTRGPSSGGRQCWESDGS